MTTPDSHAPQRVLYITRKWPPAVGGMETFSVELTRELGALTTLEVVALPGREDGRPPSPIALISFLLVQALAALRNTLPADVIHYGDFVLFPLAWLRRLAGNKALQIISIHGLDVIYGNRAGLKPAIYRLFLAWARARQDCVDRFAANSKNTAALACEAGLRNLATIPLAVRSAAGEDQPLPPAEQPPYLLFVGRLVRRKGVAWFVNEVLPRLPEPLTLKVVGKAWDLSEVEAVEAAARAEHLDYVDDHALSELRRRAIAVVMPNQRSPDNTDVEGFGIVAVETAAIGVPLVAAGIEGISDAVIDGQTGFLLADNDASAWVETLTRLLHWSEEERSQHRLRAQAAVRSTYSWERVARDYKRLYTEAWRAVASSRDGTDRHCR